ncbi:MAG: ABC transporter permease [Dehalococcoidia bacterium]|nr:ABC transporter permease [Dehalococcoidia bacterium]
MRNYIIRRILLIIPTLFLVSLVVFLSVRLIPGKVVELMAMEHPTGAAGNQIDVEAIKALLGLDKPLLTQYGKWLNDIFHGQFGKSLWTNRQLADEISLRLPITFELGLLAFIVAQIIAIPIGLYSAIRQDTAGDFIGRSFAIISLSVPGFWLGTMVMVFPSIWWRWSPPMKYTPFATDPLLNLQQFIIPALLMGLGMSGTTMRMLRTTMLEVLRQDYVRTAWSKGLRERVVVMRHGLRNALIPVVTLISGQIPVMIGGAVIMEQIFSLPGMGRLFLDSMNRRDYPFVSGINVFLAAAGMIIILITDMSYAYLDPRIRYK